MLNAKAIFETDGNELEMIARALFARAYDLTTKGCMNEAQQHLILMQKAHDAKVKFHAAAYEHLSTKYLENEEKPAGEQTNQG